MKKRKKIVVILCGILLCVAILVAGVFGLLYRLERPTVTLDFSTKTGAVTTGASGFLYGFAEPEIPSRALAAGVGASTLSTKALGGLQHPIGDVSQVAETFFGAGGKEIVIYTQDMYDTWYYKLDSLPEYLERVRQTVTETETQDYAARVVYCIYNEMNNGQWFGDFSIYENRLKTYEAWKQTYQLVKSINPNAKIGGPGYTHYDSDYQREFLEYCKAEACLPETMIWHELGTNSLYFLEDHFADYEQMCLDLDIPKMPVCITEYGLMETNGIPGESVKWISRIENSKAEGCVAYWRLANNLSDVAADDVAPNSNWWAYHWYAQMRGETVAYKSKDLFQSNVGKFLTGKSDGLKNKGFSALASLDEGSKTIQILAGGSNRDSSIVLENLEQTQSFSSVDVVCVTAQFVDYKGLGGIVSAPQTGFTRYLPIVDGTVEIELNDILYTQCYNLTVTPVDSIKWADYESGSLSVAGYEPSAAMQRLEAEQATPFGTAAVAQDIAYAASEGALVKLDSSQESGIEFTVDTAVQGTHILDLVYGNGANGIAYASDGSVADKGTRTAVPVSISIDGEQAQSLLLPSTLRDDFTDCIRFTAELTPGTHKIRITLSESASPVNTLSFDFLDVIAEQDNTAQTALPISADIKNSNSEQSAFYAIAENDGYYTLCFESAAVPTSISINDIPLENVVSADKSGNAVCTVYLHRGVNTLRLNASDAQCIDFSRYDGAEADNITVISADAFTRLGSAALQDLDEATLVGTQAKSCLVGISSASEGAAQFVYTAPSSGYYQVTFTYSANDEGGAHDYNVDLIEPYISLSLNGSATENCFFRNTYSLQTYKTKTIALYLNAGENILRFSNDGSYRFNEQTAYAPQISEVAISPASIG